MTLGAARTRRHMIPRWRPIAKTIAAGELGMPAENLPKEISKDFRARLEHWRLQRDTLSAAEVLETAIVEGQESETEGPARFLLSEASSATPLVKKQAALIMKRAGSEDEAAQFISEIEVSPIARARRRTRAFPHDAYGWTDLALAYVNRGKDRESQRAMRVALQLAPNDRHVLRSAARLLIHLDDPEAAYDLIKSSPATRNDPWLMASEIAIANRIDRTPRLLKMGVNVIDDGGFRPRHFSELAGAIGTVHLLDGNRRARKLFLKSLVDPTGNALAQAEWANPQLGGDLVEPQALERVQDSAEAKVFQAIWKGNFEEVINHCSEWHDEEPFSSRSHQFGAHAANTLEKFDLALHFSEAGLKANPNSPVLHNNKVFALISLQRYEEARPSLIHSLNKFPEESLAPLIATAGLMALRLGQFAEGRKRYRESIALFKRLGARNNEALALAYFAQEAARAGLSDSSKILREAREACKERRGIPEAAIVLRRAEAWLKATEMRHGPAQSLATLS